MNGYDSIDRQALLSHLNDVRVLELTKYKLTTQINSNTNQINRLGYRMALKKPNVWGKVSLCFILSFLVCIVVFGILGATAFSEYITDKVSVDPIFDDFSGFYLYKYFENEPLRSPEYIYIVPKQPNFNIFLLISLCVSAVLSAVIAIIMAFLRLKKFSEYKKRKTADNARVESELRQRQALMGENDKCISELKELDTVLAQNYSINIIPSQFRNVEGVCYLYDYLSTSRESFQSALINFNMNRLNINMQQMIRMQGEMLIQQYVTNARLADVKNQNSAMLSRLSAIEQNTELAAKYAAMNEMNTRTISFFKTYEFLRQS